jgi:hypothetical protein
LANNTTGSNNISIGSGALDFNTTSSNLIAIGAAALQDNTTGTRNVAIGNFSGRDITTGTDNTVIGYGSLGLATTGINNTIIGANVANNTTTASGLLAIGSNAVFANTTGSGNYIGGAVAAGNVTGTANVFFGNAAGQGNGSSTDNTYLGFGAAQFTGTGIVTVGAITGGSGYTDGTYTDVALFPTRSYVGQSARFTIVVSGGTVTSVTLTGPGSGYIVGDVLNDASGILGPGTGFTIPVSTIVNASRNTLVGRGAYQLSFNGENNTMVGYQAGRSPTGAILNRSVFLGYQAGLNETNSDRLYISNTSTTTPLIFGAFDNTGGTAGRLKINGNLEIKGKTPASASDTGVVGEIAWDADYIYICIATNTWKRSAITTW